MPDTSYILIANQKGGVGKTTIADELAFSLERRGFKVAFQNLDNQGGCIHSSTFVGQDDQFVIVDTPGAANSDFRKWCEMADLVIIPSKPSMQDYPAFNQTLTIANEVTGGKGVGCVVNFYDSRRRADKDWVAFLGNAGYPVFGVVPEATAFVSAVALRESVHDRDPRCKAAIAIEKLTDRVLEEVNHV